MNTSVSESPPSFRCGFVAVVGRPNVGKSTLVNRIVGANVCIVTPKAQTTRNRITAIYHSERAQMILLDTPGLHTPDSPLNEAMKTAALKAVENCDAAVFVTTCGPRIPPQDQELIASLKAARVPTALAVNKIDLLTDKSLLLPVLDAYAAAHEFVSLIPISATLGDGVEDLVNTLTGLLPLGPPMFPEDDLSDLPVRFFVAELIREQVTLLTGEEIPYRTAVVVESFKEREDSALIHADIHCERQGQKKILIGKQGAMIKAIGVAARRKIEEFLGHAAHLKLFVKVSPNWTRDQVKLREFGYK
jgi:GTP-binding protein Era